MLPMSPPTPAKPGCVKPGYVPTILLVEDEPLIAMLLTDIMEDAGYNVLCTAGPAQAIALVDRAAANGEPLPDLLVTDNAMPGMSGGEMAAQITARHGLMPVLLITGQLPQGDCPYPVLLKPFVEADVIAQVRRLLGE